MNLVTENDDYFEQLGETVESVLLGVNDVNNSIPKHCDTCKHKNPRQGYCLSEGTAYNCVNYIQWEPNPLLVGITHFCLGNGEVKCDGCGQEKNWQTLNQLPDTLRLAIQKTAKRINDTDCILSGRPWYTIVKDK